jgi:hypothetical protein
MRLPISLAGAGTMEAWVYLASKRSNDAALRSYIWYKRLLLGAHCLWTSRRQPMPQSTASCALLVSAALNMRSLWLGATACPMRRHRPPPHLLERRARY